jgi:hypothetical protein
MAIWSRLALRGHAGRALRAVSANCMRFPLSPGCAWKCMRFTNLYVTCAYCGASGFRGHSVDYRDYPECQSTVQAAPAIRRRPPATRRRGQADRSRRLTGGAQSAIRALTSVSKASNT